jgi:anhydro-N-acetylmuramic acid kinase
LLDQWALRHLGVPWDQDGHWASQGAVDPELLERLRSDPYFERAPPKSTGREHFNLEWLLAVLRQLPRTLLPQDVQATLLRCTVETIAEAIRRYASEAEEVLICGGGACNALLLTCLRGSLQQCRVDTTEQEGLDPRRVEAVAFAWLAKRRLAGLPGNLPSVTGAARPAILGAVYAGSL